MSYKIHMKGRDDPRTPYQIDRLYAWKHGKYFSPATVEISPTNACNQRCTYCYAWRESKSREMLRDDILIGCFDQLADADVGGVVIQGTGEPLLHKALPEAIKRGASRHIPIQLTTNGVLLNAALQDEILQHLYCLRISVIDNDPRRYADQHGCNEKQWHTLVANLERAIAVRARSNLPFSTMATVYLSENNVNDLYNCVRFCKEIGIDFVYVLEPQYTSYSPSGKRSHISSHMANAGHDIDSVCEKILSLIDDNFFVKIKLYVKEHILSGATKQTWKNDYCQGVKFYTLIGCDGEVYPCWRAWESKRYSFGSLYEKEFTEIWQGEKRRQIEEMIMRTPPDGVVCAPGTGTIGLRN